MHRRKNIDYSELREKMIRSQLAARGIQDPAVLEAMGTVPREIFIPANKRQYAYADSALPIGQKQTISQPYIVALMAEALEPERDDRVLEIGTGSGYAAAILSRIVSQVYTVERHAQLARKAKDHFKLLGYKNIHIHVGDGTLGWRQYAPYDAIIVTAGGPEIPNPLLEQLETGGRLVIPVGAKHEIQNLVRVDRIDEDKYQRQSLGSVRFVPLIGEVGW